ncbi:MAG: T9SS type A sorting domain-containing protein [bacterium]|nr:T9SS type A sorting domain-containing protein [bacterium]
MTAIQDSFTTSKLRILAINIGGTQDILKQYARGNSALFLLDASSSAFSLYYITSAIPLNYIIRPNGKVFHGIPGGYCEAQIKSYIDSCLIGIEEPNTVSTVQNPTLVLSPNPFKVAMMISAKGIKTAGDLQIQDLTGRVVKSFSLAPNSTVKWDRKDNNGREVPVGMYFCRFNNGDVNLTGKVVMFK